MEVLKGPWETILWDFVIKLLKSKDPVIGQEYDSILVMVDKLTKWGYFILYTEEMSAKDLSKIYVKEVFIQHGAPVKIILDQDLRFIAAFWEAFTAKQGTQIAISTAYYLQTNR